MGGKIPMQFSVMWQIMLFLGIWFSRLLVNQRMPDIVEQIVKRLDFIFYLVTT